MTMEPTPTWRRAPLTKSSSSSSLSNSFNGSGRISPTARHSLELPNINGNRQRNDAAIGPDSTVPYGSAQKIQFIQDQHSHALSSLLAEIERLKAENRDLKFRLVLRDSAAHADAGSSAAIQKELTGVRHNLDTVTLERDDLQFDLRTANKRIAELEERTAADAPSNVALEEENRRLYLLLREHEKEITRIRERHNTEEQSHGVNDRPPVSSGPAHMSERPYVFHSQDLKQQAAGRRLTRQQLSSLADQRRRVRAVRRYDGLGGPNAHGKRQSLPALNFRTSQEQSQQQQFHE